MELDPLRAETVGEWFDLCHRLGVRLAEATAMAGQIVAALGSPERSYHSLRHVRDCLKLLAEADLDEADLAVAELAVWFHDLVYDPGRPDNESRSAEAAGQWLTDQGIEAAEVVAIIDMTGGHGLPEDAGPAMVAVHDVDLAVLGSPADEYLAYASAIRDEYAHLSDDDYRAGRLAALEKLSDVEPLYALPRFRAALEDRARANIAAEMASLRRG